MLKLGRLDNIKHLYKIDATVECGAYYICMSSQPVSTHSPLIRFFDRYGSMASVLIEDQQILDLVAVWFNSQYKKSMNIIEFLEKSLGPEISEDNKKIIENMKI